MKCHASFVIFEKQQYLKLSSAANSIKLFPDVAEFEFDIET